MTGPDSEVRVLRSPYWAVGWAFVVFAVVLTPVFLVAIDWSNWSLTFGDVLNLAKVPITSLIIGSIGLSVARPKIVSTDRDVRVVNFVRSTTLTWD